MGSLQCCTLRRVRNLLLTVMMPPKSAFFSHLRYIYSYFMLSSGSQEFLLSLVNNLIAEMFVPQCVSDPVYAAANSIPHLLVLFTISPGSSSEILTSPSRQQCFLHLQQPTLGSCLPRLAFLTHLRSVDKPACSEQSGKRHGRSSSQW